MYGGERRDDFQKLPHASAEQQQADDEKNVIRPDENVMHAGVEKLPDNTRADVKFFDAKGNEVTPGATGVAQGDKVPVPHGSTYCEISGASSAASCTGCTPPGGGGMAEGIEGRLVQNLSTRIPAPPLQKWVYVYTLDADIDGSTLWGNVSGSFTLQGSPSATEIHSQIVGILSGGHGTAVPPGVNVDTFVRILPEKQGGRMFIADKTGAFTAMTMLWNGNPFAALGGRNALVSAAPNGWQVIEVFISTKDFNLTSGGGSSNHLDLSWTTAEDTIANEMHQGISYF